MSHIGNETIGGFLDGLASASPTPGGGAVAALEGATGSALIAMVCNLTIDKAGYEEAQQRVRGILLEAEQARPRFIELADRDATAFDAVIAAFKLPKGSDAEKAARSQAIQRAYEGAAGPPLEIARLAATQMEFANEVTEIGNAHAASDGACAALALWASVWSATYNVEINAAALKDTSKAQALRDEVSMLRANGAALLDATNATFATRLG